MNFLSNFSSPASAALELLRGGSTGRSRCSARRSSGGSRCTLSAARPGTNRGGGVSAGPAP